MSIKELPVDILSKIVSDLGWSDKVSLFRSADVFHQIDSIRYIFCRKNGQWGTDETCCCFNCKRLVCPEAFIKTKTS